MHRIGHKVCLPETFTKPNALEFQVDSPDSQLLFCKREGENTARKYLPTAKLFFLRVDPEIITN